MFAVTAQFLLTSVELMKCQWRRFGHVIAWQKICLQFNFQRATHIWQPVTLPYQICVVDFDIPSFVHVMTLYAAVIQHIVLLTSRCHAAHPQVTAYNVCDPIARRSAGTTFDLVSKATITSCRHDAAYCLLRNSRAIDSHPLIFLTLVLHIVLLCIGPPVCVCLTICQWLVVSWRLPSLHYIEPDWLLGLGAKSSWEVAHFASEELLFDGNE